MFVVTNFHPSFIVVIIISSRPFVPPVRSSIFIHVHPNPLFSSIILVVMKKKRQQKGAAIAASSSLASSPQMPLPPSLLLHNKKERAYKRLESFCSTCATSSKSNSCAKEIEEQTKLYTCNEIGEQKMTNSKCAKNLKDQQMCKEIGEP
jgi:hypothetical protein